MTDRFVSIVRDAAVAIVTLNRPDKLNALTPAMLDQLEDAARAIEADDETRVVILAGGGVKAFCVGADINEWAALRPLDMWRHWVRRGHQVFDQWARLRQPVIAAINGHAFGGGLELAITADVRIAAEEARFALPEASIATCPGWSGTQRLVRLTGASHAKYLVLSGARVTAADARACGLVHEVVPQDRVLERAHRLALDMAARAPVALQLTKQLLNAASGEETGSTLEAMAGALAASTEDAAEGIRSFSEKRPPIYVGR
ncbi:enoyl-CoA hydratase/isomerase family protein [Caballeronia sp. LP003]|uniref:enoyl-CoA hydratase/isomerase family protein n=1 Tax=Caballeronia sp. LP003 TaxID=3038551 RepID=UPI0028595C59|nr:enoyl-CoA hydratase/isomerase family protein [Caballeronia sp. LP003]MDR5789646.1 enoyl-CoA hydratase/isomerase family protein [Caballeronia sp. LP003]